MIRKNCPFYLLLLVLGSLILLAPASATIAVYGSTSGFNTSLHAEYGTTLIVPGQNGSFLDQTVTEFTARDVSLIFIGNDGTFSSTTASAIEQAVWDGRILIVSYPATVKFSDSLPLITDSITTGGNYLEPVSTTDPVVHRVFPVSGIKFNITGLASAHIMGLPKPGTGILLKYDTGEPALAYRKYGNGYVIEWAMPSPESILGTDEADRINSEVIASLTGPVSPTPVVTTLPLSGTPTPSSTVTLVPSISPNKATGNITVQSNPLGATVFIDGIYQGVTPLELSGFTPGYHAVKMTKDGRYDYDGSVYVVSDERVTAFGSLPQQGSGTPVITQAGVEPTTTPAPSSDPFSSPTVIAATIGAITAGIAAFATIYSQTKGKK
jgi:hypothetical protein